jgi:hypothetical protein
MEQKSDSKKVFHAEINRLLIFLVRTGFDTLEGLAVFADFLLFAWVLKFARILGWGDADHLKAFEEAHFWLNITLFSTVALALFLQVFRALWKHESDFMEALRRRRAKSSNFFARFGADTLIGLTTFGFFLGVDRVIWLSRVYGLGSEEHLKAYDTVYFWATYASFIAVGFFFLRQMWRALRDEFK